MNNTVYWMLLTDNGWNLHIAATDDGLCYVGSPNAPFDEMTKWIKKKFPKHHIIEDKTVMQPYRQELIEYLNGTRQSFTIPLDFQGTDFQISIWKELMKIPYGETTTYTEVAERLHRPDAVRAVGTAIGANPMLVIVPCHRLFGKNGKSRGYRGGNGMKDKLIAIENIEMP